MKDCTLKIKLLEIRPIIWRRFVVPSNITLDRLHDVIQIVMGWKDCHLYEFSIDQRRFSEELGSPEDGFESGKYRLKDIVEKKGDKAHYLYDFGDSWEHELIFEGSRHINPSPFQAKIECLDGARACPPEDVGGVTGYTKFCKVLKNPNHEEYSEYKNWYKGLPWNDDEFERDRFDIDKINYELLKYLRWSRDRYSSWKSK